MTIDVKFTGAVVKIPSRGERLWRLVRGRDVGVLAMAVLAWLVMALTVSNFNSPDTLYYLLLDLFPVLMLALPMTMIVVTGEVDLSVGSMTGLASVVVGLAFKGGMPIPVGVALGVLVGVLGGALNGLLVARAGLASLAVTIGTLSLFRGLAVGGLGSGAITGFPMSYQDLISGRLGSTGSAFPTVTLVFLAAAAIFIVWLHYTPFGRGVYAVGLNPSAAAFSGVSAARTKMVLFMVSGAMAGLMGAFWALRYDSARGDNASGLELLVVASVLVGGVSFFGGKGSLAGVIFGCLVIGALRSGLRLGGLSDEAVNVAVGVLLIGTVVAPRVVGLLRARRGLAKRALTASETAA